MLVSRYTPIRDHFELHNTQNRTLVWLDGQQVLIFSVGGWSRVRGMVMVRVTLGGGLEHFADWRQVGVPFVGFPLYKYVVGGVKGDCRNIFHERSVCGFLRAVLEQQFQASFVDMYINVSYSNHSKVEAHLNWCRPLVSVGDEPLILLRVPPLLLVMALSYSLYLLLLVMSLQYYSLYLLLLVMTLQFCLSSSSFVTSRGLIPNLEGEAGQVD